MDFDSMHLYLEEHGWHYDNAWKYLDEGWGSYVRNDSMEIRVLELWPRFVIVRNPGANTGEEIWRGEVATKQDLQTVIDTANAALAK